MYISNIYIENFRNFKSINIPLKPFTIIVGKNDTGKSNLVDALNIVLYNDKGNYYAKSLSKYDFNTLCVKSFCEEMKLFYKKVEDKFNLDKYVDELIDNAPFIVIRLKFEDPKGEYEQSLLRDWMNGDENLIYFEVEYRYFLKDRRKLKEIIADLVKEDLIEDRHADFQLFSECYDYSIISTNNNKSIDFTKIRNFVANTIVAERDTFSSGDTFGATRVVANIIDSSLDHKDKAELSKRYNDFFDGIQSLESFRNIYKDIVSQNKSIQDFISDIKLVPSAKKYKDIIENITLSYGDDMLFQRGLGTRNLIFLLTLYSYFLNDPIERRKFNLICIEEPESHLDIDNLKISIEFFKKARKRNSLTQLLISTHNNQIINKLDLSNVIILLENDIIVNLSDIDPNMMYYLEKRENYDTLNMLYANRLILVEGSTEEIYLNTLLKHNPSLNNVRVISIGQKGFRTFIEAWTSFHIMSQDKLGIIRDYDNQDNAKKDHEAYNSNVIHVATSLGKEFENDFINKDNNLDELNSLLSTNYTAEEMYNNMISDKLNIIIKICRAIERGEPFSVPDYINNLLEWIQQ